MHDEFQYFAKCGLAFLFACKFCGFLGFRYFRTKENVEI